MKKLLLLLGLAALVFTGCGGGDDKSGDGFSGKGGGDFCDLAKQYEKDFADTSSGSGTQADTKKQFQELTAAIKKLVAEAPGEIKSDTQKVGDVFEKYDKVLAKYDYDFSKIPEAEAKQISFDDPEVMAASNRVESYFEKVCKIDSDGDGDTDGVIDNNSSSTTEDTALTETTAP